MYLLVIISLSDSAGKTDRQTENTRPFLNTSVTPGLPTLTGVNRSPCVTFIQTDRLSRHEAINKFSVHSTNVSWGGELFPRNSYCSPMLASKLKTLLSYACYYTNLGWGEKTGDNQNVGLSANRLVLQMQATLRLHQQASCDS